MPRPHFAAEVDRKKNIITFLLTISKEMPVGLALVSAERIAFSADDSILLALTYRSFPSETLYCILKVLHDIVVFQDQIFTNFILRTQVAVSLLRFSEDRIAA